MTLPVIGKVTNNRYKNETTEHIHYSTLAFVLSRNWGRSAAPSTLAKVFIYSTIGA